MTPYGFPTGPTVQTAYANPLFHDARHAGVIAARIYHPKVAALIAEALSFMGQHNWTGDQVKLRELIDGIRADAARYGQAAA